MNPSLASRLWLILLFALFFKANTLLAEEKQSGDFKYASNGSAITITGYTGEGGAVTIPDKIGNLPVRRIGKGSGVFGGKTLTSVTIPDSVTYVDAHAFHGCDCKKITLGKGLAAGTLPGFKFTGTPLLAIDVAADHPDLCSVDGVLFDKNKTILLAYPRGKQGSYTIPDEVVAIDGWAFGYCTGLTDLFIPKSVIRHEMTSFRADGTALQKIEVAEDNPAYCSVNGVLFNADQTRLIRYSGARKGNYVIPSGVTSIDPYAFTGSPGLTAVTIPNSVTSIGYYAFGNCENLNSALFEGDAPSYDEMIDNVFAFKGSAPDFTIYHRPGAKSFTTRAWRDYPAKEGEPPAAPPSSPSPPALATPLSWTNNDGKTIKAEFVRLDEEAVIVRLEDGKESKISFTRLSPESVAQAKALGKE